MCTTTPSAEFTLPMDVLAPALARRLLLETVCVEHAAHVLEVSQLLTSELVTNAMRYGAPPVTVHIDCDESVGLQVRVSDTSSTEPVPRDADRDAEGGRGLTLVDVISTAWGVERTDGGKTIWFQIAR